MIQRGDWVLMGKEFSDEKAKQTTNRRWRERKVVLKVKLDALGLSPAVRSRLESVLGPRYSQGVAKVVADK
jgi:hypothetical protein